jgi:hypothetical protein
VTKQDQLKKAYELFYRIKAVIHKLENEEPQYTVIPKDDIFYESMSNTSNELPPAESYYEHWQNIRQRAIKAFLSSKDNK